MSAKRYITFKKDEHKCFSFLGAVVGFIIATLFAYWVARSDKTSAKIPAVILVCVMFGTMGGQFLAKRLKANKLNVEDDFIKKKESRFSYAPDFELPLFGGILAIIFSYLAIYLSEVLNLVKDYQLNNPTPSFSELFIDIAKNIFLVDWARKYLIEYWIWLTIYVLIMIIATIWATNKIKKLQREEREKKENNKENSSKFQ